MVTLPKEGHKTSINEVLSIAHVLMEWPPDRLPVRCSAISSGGTAHYEKLNELTSLSNFYPFTTRYNISPSPIHPIFREGLRRYPSKSLNIIYHLLSRSGYLAPKGSITPCTVSRLGAQQ